MNREDIKVKIIELIASGLAIDASGITEESTFDELGADSLDVVELVMGFEEAFDIEIDDEKAESLSTVSKVVDYLESELN